MESLIAADNTALMWAALFGLAAFGAWIDRSRFGKIVSGVVWVIFAATLLANINVLPKSAPAYSIIWGEVIPISIMMLLYKADLRRIIAESGRVFLAFVIGAVGVVLGVALGITLLPLGDNAADFAAVFSATYIGGSVNFAAVSETINMPDGIKAAAIAADNIAGTVFLIILAALPALRFIQNRFIVASSGSIGEDADAPAHETARLELLPTAAALMTAFALTFAGREIAGLIGWGSGDILISTLLVITCASLMPGLFGKMADQGFQIGLLLMYLFFVAIGTGADIALMIDKGLVLFAFAMLVLSVHLVTLLVVGKLFKLEVAEMVIGSNACILGAGTAAAQAGSMGWRGLVTPGVLTGTFGYAVASFIGVAMYGLLG